MVEGSPVEILCSYAREDETWLRKLKTHLSLLQRQHLVSFWHDRLILPGTDWVRVIDTHLETASVILLLISSDFFASDYCYGIEMKRALERHEAGEARVIPILVRPVDWTNAPFAHLQVLPTDAKPPAVWQDEDTALADIAAGVRRVIEDLPWLSASAPRATLPKIWNIPYPRNPFFLGRDTALLQMRQNLQVGQSTALSQPQAISGLGGIGKTQLALEYAYRYHLDYQAVLWAHAESAEAMISSYIALATLLHLPECEAKEQDITIRAMKTWLQTHRSWLLILDNADELNLLLDFLPPSLGGHLLLTTRASATGRLARRLEIETLLPEQGALFLLRRATLLSPNTTLEQASSEERELALQISQDLGGLPLALDQAGAYLEETGIDLAEYRHLYQQHRADLLRERRGLVPDHPSPVATTWLLSFQKVTEKNPAAAELLRLCAYLTPDAIPEEILTTGTLLLGMALAPIATDAFLFHQAIEALRAYSLIQRDSNQKLLSIHRLVQAVLQDTLEQTQKQFWAERAMCAVNATFPRVKHATWSQCERLLPCALLVAHFIETHQIVKEEAERLLRETGIYLRDRARYSEAEPLFLCSLHIREQQLGPEHPDVAYPLNYLASLYRQQGKYPKAEPLYQRALRIREQQLGPEHPDVAHSLNHLASLYRLQGKYTEAELLYQRALHIREQQLGPEHLEVSYSLNHLAGLYRQQGKYDEVEPLYQRALHIRKELLGPEHPQVAFTLQGLANLYREQGKYDEAEFLYQQALHIREKTFGLEHPDVAYSLNHLASLYHQLGKHGEAESLYQRALHIEEQELGPEHPDVAYPLNNLGSLYRQQGKYMEAEVFCQRALYIREKTQGMEHPDVVHPLNNLANLYREQGKYDKAEPLYQRALHIREQAVGPEHPEMAEVIYDFALLRDGQGNRDEARSLYIRALAIREKALGMDHPKTTETRTHLIALLHAMGQHEAADQHEAGQSEP